MPRVVRLFYRNAARSGSYETPQVYGEAIRAVVHEEFGDGIVSAVDVECRVDRVEANDGDRVRITDDGKFLPYRKW